MITRLTIKGNSNNNQHLIILIKWHLFSPTNLINIHQVIEWEDVKIKKKRMIWIHLSLNLVKWLMILVQSVFPNQDTLNTHLIALTPAALIAGQLWFKKRGITNKEEGGMTITTIIIQHLLLYQDLWINSSNQILLFLIMIFKLNVQCVDSHFTPMNL